MSTTVPVTIPFETTRTCRSLQSACAGELQAREQYLAAARRCEAAHLHVVAHTFRFTAAQEKEHAAIFAGLLSAMGASAEAPSLPPPELPEDPVEMLLAVSRNEHSEWDQLYPVYARIAEEEGFPRIAGAFTRIAETEHLHARRFLQFAKALRTDTLFSDRQRVSWLCLQCGQIHCDRHAPSNCSTCGRDQGHFLRSSFEPFTVHP